jgi:DNA-binding response OmpR family regulator
MMCARCTELEEENRQLRRELSYELDLAKADLFQAEWGLTPQEANLLKAIYDAGGRPLREWQLSELLPKLDHGERSELSNISNVLICRLRKKCGPGFIVNVWGKGHKLSDAARKRCDAILQPEQVAA